MALLSDVYPRAVWTLSDVPPLNGIFSVFLYTPADAIGFTRLVRRAPEITGLFCINDSMALGAIAAGNELGRKCPRDLSVVGFGDFREGNYWQPRLTTFALSSNHVAEEALKLVREHRNKNGIAPRTVLIAEDLIIRDSTGPVIGNAQKHPA